MASQDLGLIPAVPALKDRRTTPDHIAEALREAILAGVFKDGEELNQVALAEHFGVSRVPIREALRQLQAEGLITAAAHRRAVVTGLTAEGLLEIFDIRALLEGYLLEKALLRMDEGHLATLRRLCDEGERAKDHRDWLRLNREFHRTLFEPSSSRITVALVEQLTGRVERYLHLWSAGKGINRVQEASAEHRAILQAVERNDLQRARLEIQMHISHTRQGVLDQFPERPDGDKAAD